MTSDEKKQQIADVQDRIREVVKKLRRAPMNSTYTDQYEALQRKLERLQSSK